MQLAPRIEACPAPWALVPASKVLLDCHLPVTPSAEHHPRLRLDLLPGPDLVRVISQGFVAGDAGVVCAAAEVLDGDDVERRVPVRALRQGRDIHAMDDGLDGRG